MAELIERLTGATTPKIGVETLLGCLNEVVRGNMTQAQMVTMIQRDSGAPLTQNEYNEALAIANTVLAIPVTGTAVQIAQGTASRAMKLHDIQFILRTAEQSVPSGSAPLATAAAVRARLGI